MPERSERPATQPSYLNLIMDARLSIYFAITCTLIACLSGISHKADLLCQFRVQMGAALAFMTVVLALSFKTKLTKSSKLLIAAALATLLNLVCVLYTCVDFSALTAGSEKASPLKISVLQFNVESKNEQRPRFMALVHELNPDVICLQEVDSFWAESLHKLKIRAAYPYELMKIRNDNFGVAIYSKRPFLSSSIEGLGKANVPTAVATVDCGGKPVTFISTHPLPPLNGEWYDYRNIQFNALADYCKRDANKSYVLCGDLNCAPWSAHFINLLSRSGLKDSRVGFGIGASWPVNCWVLRIPLDHVLMSRNIETKVRLVQRDCGSDHLPVYAELLVH